MTAIASSSPSASIRRSAIQSGIECRSAARVRASGVELGEPAPGVGGQAAHDRVDHPRPGRRPHLRTPEGPGLTHGLVDRSVGGNAVGEGDLVCTEPQDVAHRGLEGGRPVERAVDEPVERAPPLYRAVGEAGGLGAGTRVELGPAHLRGERAVGVGAVVDAAQHAQRDAALARHAVRRGGRAHAGVHASGPRHPCRNALACIRPRPGGWSSTISSVPEPV